MVPRVEPGAESTIIQAPSRYSALAARANAASTSSNSHLPADLPVSAFFVPWNCFIYFVLCSCASMEIRKIFYLLASLKLVLMCGVFFLKTYSSEQIAFFRVLGF